MAPTQREYCGGHADLPLPCTRELWEPVTDGEWARRYQQDLASKEHWRPGPLRVGDLMLPQRCLGGEPTQPAEYDVADELAAWCEKVDEFGTLLWVSTMLDRRR